ncbi:ATP-binding cassette domain-containing protein [Ureaplasma parvum]|jgi:putative bacitracin ABC transporter, ATP-binding protein BcrA|nr:ATP-binding cassette domain-containing protein [Ureaplasma parvum]
MKDIILRTNNLTKKYKDFTALNNANITINKGDIYGLIGRNGAGKTTLMKVITTLTNKTNGEFYLFDKDDSDLTETKRRIGCLIENPAFFENLTAYQNLKYYAIQKGIVDYSQIDKVLDLVKLSDSKNKKFKTFSLGMKQRLGIAFAMLDNPDFVILDEPINGLDPIGISELRETLKKLNEESNITMLISSHILSELYLLANRFCFIEKGKIIKELSKEELDVECSRAIVIKTNNVKETCLILEKELNTKNYKVIDKHEVRLYDYLDNSGKVNKELAKNDIDVISIYESGISLEDYFKSILKEAE